MAQEYGLMATISTQQDLGPEYFFTEEGQIERFSSVDEAVERAEEHSKEPLWIKDWIYDVVPLFGKSYGKPIRSYCSIPKFHEIKNGSS